MDCNVAKDVTRKAWGTKERAFAKGLRALAWSSATLRQSACVAVDPLRSCSPLELPAYHSLHADTSQNESRT